MLLTQASKRQNITTKITRRENNKIATIYHNTSSKFDIALTYEIIIPNISFIDIISLYNLHHRDTSGVQNSTQMCTYAHYTTFGETTKCRYQDYAQQDKYDSIWHTNYISHINIAETLTTKCKNII